MTKETTAQERARLVAGMTNWQSTQWTRELAQAFRKSGRPGTLGIERVRLAAARVRPSRPDGVKP